MHPPGFFGEYQILHLGVGLLITGLAEQYHHDDPLDLLDVDIGRFVNANLHQIDGIERTLTTLTFKAF